MDWLYSLFFGDSIAHSMVIFSLVITLGVILGKVKIGGVALGVTWVLFIGIIFSHFGMVINPEVLHFVKEFGLIIFVFSIGLQVGPGFFAAFKNGGITLVGLATAIVLLGVATTYVIHLVTGTDIATMVGVLSGAVTNTPGLGAAQQAYLDVTGDTQNSIAMAYAVAYPLGVVGIIMSLIAIRYLFRVKFEQEDKALSMMNPEHRSANKFSIEFTNKALAGHTVSHMHSLVQRQFVISRVSHLNGDVTIADGSTVVELGEKMLVISSADDTEAIIAFFGKRIEMEDADWKTTPTVGNELVSRRILITKSNINGKKFSDLRLRTRYGINITRVNRAGVDLIPYQGMELHIGDRVMVVGPQQAIDKAASVLGDSLKKLREPNLITIFLGIALGVLLGSLPLVYVPQAVKLGLAGGPLIVAILIGRFGTHFNLVTYTTMSANLMLREVGIALFLAAVGLGAGENFVEAVVNGGYQWIGYGAIITIVPIMIVGVFARLKLKLNYYTLMGLVSGSLTDPPALAYSNSTAGNDMPAVAYATVYPFVMFLRVVSAQLLILLAL